MTLFILMYFILIQVDLAFVIPTILVRTSCTDSQWLHCKLGGVLQLFHMEACRPSQMFSIVPSTATQQYTKLWAPMHDHWSELKEKLTRNCPPFTANVHTHTLRTYLEAAHGTKYHDGSVLDESRTNGNKLSL